MYLYLYRSHPSQYRLPAYTGSRPSHQGGHRAGHGCQHRHCPDGLERQAVHVQRPVCRRHNLAFRPCALSDHVVWCEEEEPRPLSRSVLINRLPNPLAYSCQGKVVNLTVGPQGAGEISSLEVPRQLRHQTQFQPLDSNVWAPRAQKGLHLTSGRMVFNKHSLAKPNGHTACTQTSLALSLRNFQILERITRSVTSRLPCDH